MEFFKSSLLPPSKPRTKDFFLFFFSLSRGRDVTSPCDPEDGFIHGERLKFVLTLWVKMWEGGGGRGRGDLIKSNKDRVGVEFTSQNYCLISKLPGRLLWFHG